MSSQEERNKSKINDLDSYFQRIRQEEQQTSSESSRHQRPQQERQQRGNDEEDEESGLRYFVSEPSMTSEGGDSESIHRDRILNLLSPVRDEEAAAAAAPPDLSPGGTSLSSRDSSLLGGKGMVQVHVTPEHQLRKRLHLPFIPDATDLNLPDLLGKRPAERDRGLESNGDSKPGGNQSAAAEEARKSSNFRQNGPSSSSSVSPSTIEQTGAFLRDLKEQSRGALKDAGSDEHVSAVGATADQKEVDAVMRHLARENQVHRHLHRSHSAETDKIDNSVDSSLINTGDADETLVMTLSETDDDEVRTTHTEATPLDWEQKHSADDEQTPDSRPRRKRWLPSASKAGHRRTRSGDDAAASLMTGGLQWKGMERDHLPIPPPHEEADEDDETVEDERPKPVHHRTKSMEAIPFDEKWLASDQQHVNSGGDGSASSSNRGRRGGEWQRSSSQGLELRQAGPELTPETFSQFALESPAYPPSTLAGSFSRIEYSPSVYGGGALGGPSYGRGHGRFSSDASANSSLTRESAFSWLSQSDRLSSNSVSQSDRLSTSAPQSERLSTSLGASQYPDRTAPGTKAQEDPIHSELSSQYDDDDGSEGYYSASEEEERDIMHNRMQYPPEAYQSLPEAERVMESRDYRGNAQHMIRHSKIISPFANIGKPRTPAGVFSMTGMGPENDFPTFICPRCNTVQREFFTVATAPSQFQSPAGYLAVYFGIYVIAALYIFGLEEGWAPLDCIYFAVITLTTAGIGDFVPTSDGAKIICSIFIYFGVACIGLLLGTYLAGMMDDKSEQEAESKRVENCSNCARLNDLRRQRKRQEKIAASSRQYPRTRAAMMSEVGAKRWISERNLDLHARGHDLSVDTHGWEGAQSTRPLSSTLGSISEDSDHLNRDMQTPSAVGDRKTSEDQREVIGGFAASPQGDSAVFGSPMTTRILSRQGRTRHMSIGHDQQSLFFGSPSPARTRKTSEDLMSSPAIPEGKPYEPEAEKTATDEWREDGGTDEGMVEDDESVSSSSTSLSEEIKALSGPDKVKTAKYIFLTLKQALVNSILIIVIGGTGFHILEKLSYVDSFYFVTVLLTTVGYGDIHPVTNGGKLFATVYVLVAGTVLLNNMSLISMIPLELRKRRVERIVLTQFGDQLDDITLRELATGPLIQRLKLSHKPSTTGLDECTREMFALAMLVRLGKVTERDIRETFAAFRSLDVDNDGVLSSKSIISGMITARRRKSQQNLQAMADEAEQTSAPPPPPPPFAHEVIPPNEVRDYWYGDQGSLHVSTTQGEVRFPREGGGSDRRSFSLSPRFRPNSTERTSLYAENQGYDSLPQHDEEQGPFYEDDDDVEHSLSRSLA